MSCAPFTCCSIEAATDCATTSALAPGKAAFTVTCGGTTCGYCAIGNPNAASTPTRIMRSAMTVEKTGRSMKKLSIARLSGLRGSGDRFHHGAGAHLAGSFHHDAISGGEAARHHPVGADAKVRHDRARLRLVARADHEHRLRSLQLLHRLLRHADRVRAVEHGHDHAHEEARAKQPVGIGDGDTHLERAALLVAGAVDEVDPARHLRVADVGETHLEV